MSESHSLDSLLQESAFLLELIDNLGSAVIVINLDKLIKFVNKRAEEITQFKRDELLERPLMETIFVPLFTSKCNFEVLISEGSCEFDTLIRKKGGEDFYAHVFAKPLYFLGRAVGVVLNFFDVTQTKELEKRLLQASLTDYLTKLYNRRALEDFLKREKAISDRYGIPFSLILLDLDYFKMINDLYGHQVGDRVLVEVANLLKSNLREADIVGRWGGEEFLIILPNTRFDEAIKVAEKLRNLLCNLKVPPVEVITGSFGVSEYRQGESYEETLRRADIALYKAKSEGKNCVIVF